jgi:DNA-binding CsgD family transcriptional regulator
VEVILQRLDFLSRKTRNTLEMAAVLGRTIDVAELSPVLNMSTVDLLGIVDEATQAGLIVDTGQLVFRHDLIREALAKHLPASTRSALRVRAGQVLAAAHAPVERVAEYLLAGTGLDQRSVAWLAEAADSLIVRAPEQAVGLLQRALVTAVDPMADGLRLQLVRALLWEGSLSEAEQAARTALAASRDPTQQGALSWLLAQACFRRGRVDEAVKVAEEALSSRYVTPADEGRFHGLAAMCLLFQKRLDAMDVAASKAIAAGEASGDQVSIGYGLYSLAALRNIQGVPSQGLKLVDRALLMFARGIQPDLQVDPYGLRGHSLLDLDRLAEADESLAISVRHNQQTGGVYRGLVQLGRTRVRFLDGRWDDALVEIQTGLEMSDPLGYTIALPSLAALIAIHRGSYRADTGTLPEPDERPGRGYAAAFYYWAKALIEETQLELGPALKMLARAREATRELYPPSYLAPLYPDFARLAFTSGDRDETRELAAVSEAFAEEEPAPGRMGAALLCRGLADDDPDALLSAADFFRQAGRPLYEGQAYENAAVVLAHRDRTTEARDALNRALALYTGLEAAWDVARAEARLRQAGIRLGRHGPRKRPKHGWDALTDTENRVALLVAEGCSNSDIATRMLLSRRTVQTHVSSILAKLSFSSRVELAIGAARRSGDDR